MMSLFPLYCVLVGFIKEVFATVAKDKFSVKQSGDTHVHLLCSDDGLVHQEFRVITFYFHLLLYDLYALSMVYVRLFLFWYIEYFEVYEYLYV